MDVGTPHPVSLFSSLSSDTHSGRLGKNVADIRGSLALRVHPVLSDSLRSNAMLRATYVNLYSLLYGFFLWASVYFIHNNTHVHLRVHHIDVTFGVIFLALVSTFRDLAQLSGLRFKSLLVLIAVCAYLWYDLDGKVAYAAIAALFWAEILDFTIFTVILSNFRSIKGIMAAIIISDVVTIPALWFMLLGLLGVSITELPNGIFLVQYTSLAILYVLLAAIFLHNGRWRDYLSVQKAR